MTCYTMVQSQLSEQFGGDLTFEDGGGERVEFQLHGIGGPESYKFGFDTGKGYFTQYILLFKQLHLINIHVTVVILKHSHIDIIICQQMTYTKYYIFYNLKLSCMSCLPRVSRVEFGFKLKFSRDKTTVIRISFDRFMKRMEL